MTNSINIEEWRDIPRYEGRYQASSMGRIRSVDHVVRCGKSGTRISRGKLIAIRKANNGYHMVSLCHPAPRLRTRLVHQLVADTFLGNAPAGHIVSHRNGDRFDNRACNLYYCTYSEAQRAVHARRRERAA